MPAIPNIRFNLTKFLSIAVTTSPYSCIMLLFANNIFKPQQITHSHENGYVNDRLNAQRVLAVISLLIPFFLFAIYAISPHTSDSGSAYLLNMISTIVIVTAIIRLIKHWHTPREDFHQLTCAFLDFFGIAAILVAYAFIYDVPIAVALKSPTANIFFVFLTSRVVLLNGPILLKTCGAATSIWLALTSLAMFDPAFTGTTSSYIEYLTSFKILIGAEVERVLQFIIITAILYTFIHLVRHDPATGYLRRPIFLQSIAKFLVHSKNRTPGKTHALLELRITSLSSTNKIYDSVFKLVSELPMLRTVKVQKIGRLSNRNIAVWVTYPHAQINLNEFTNRLSNELTQTVISRLGSHVPPIIIGGTLFDFGASGEEQLVFTDIAIQDALVNGKQARVFDEGLRASISRKEHVIQAIEHGLRHNLFSVHYQPIIDLMTDRPIGFEALIRLTDENGDNIPPNLFIPIAENTGLISDISDRLCSIIASDAPTIANKFLAENIQPYININISPHQLNDIDRTVVALKSAQVSRVKIKVEITESSVLNEANTLAQIETLKRAGFSLAIDDFGTGHSSLSRLSKLTVSTLKIDQCFVQEIEDPKGYDFLKAIVDLSLTASESVIIEGVETLAQKLLLMKMGVRFCQGYYFAKPMNLDDLEEFLQNQYGVIKLSQNRIGRIASF